MVDIVSQFRVRPEDITLNIGENTPIPVPNMPGKWKAIIHDNTVTWLANWTENINGNHKYVFLAAGSSLKGQSDMMKFEKARELKVRRYFFGRRCRMLSRLLYNSNMLIVFAKTIKQTSSQRLWLIVKGRQPCILSINLRFVRVMRRVKTRLIRSAAALYDVNM